MSKLKLTADSGGGTVAIKGPSSTTGNAAIELTVPGTGNSTLATTSTAGKILQVKNTIKTDTASTTGDTFVDISGLTISITPSSSSNKILFRGYVAMGTQLNGTGTLKIFRDSTEIGKSTADGTTADNSTGYMKILNAGSATTSGRSQVFQVQFEVLDSPSTTSAITYKCQFAETHINNTVYVNRPFAGTDADHHGVISSITAMEVAA